MGVCPREAPSPFSLLAAKPAASRHARAAPRRKFRVAPSLKLFIPRVLRGRLDTARSAQPSSALSPTTVYSLKTQGLGDVPVSPFPLAPSLRRIFTPAPLLDAPCAGPLRTTLPRCFLRQCPWTRWLGVGGHHGLRSAALPVPTFRASMAPAATGWESTHDWHASPNCIAGKVLKCYILLTLQVADGGRIVCRKSVHSSGSISVLCSGAGGKSGMRV